MRRGSGNPRLVYPAAHLASDADEPGMQIRLGAQQADPLLLGAVEFLEAGDDLPDVGAGCERCAAVVGSAPEDDSWVVELIDASTMSWSCSAGAVMPLRAARKVSRVLAVSRMRNDVLVATMTSLRASQETLYRNVAIARYKVMAAELGNQGNMGTENVVSSLVARRATGSRWRGLARAAVARPAPTRPQSARRDTRGDHVRAATAAVLR